MRATLVALLLLHALLPAPPASALALLGETLTIEAAFPEDPAHLSFEIVATDSTVRVIGGGYLRPPHDVELRGASVLEIDSLALSRSELRNLEVYDDSQVFLRGGLLSEFGSDFSFFDRSHLEIAGGGITETRLRFAGESTGVMSSGTLATYADLTVTEDAEFSITDGLIFQWAALVFAGALVEISGGYIQESPLALSGVSFESGLAVVRGGEWVFPGERGWVIGGALVRVYGTGLAVSGGRLTGTLADGHALDIAVEGNLENLELVPEPGASALFALACGAMLARRARRARS